MKNPYYENPDYNIVSISNIKDLGELIFFDVLNKKCVTAVLYYDEAKELLRELMYYPNINVHSIELSPDCSKGYSKEYYVSLLDDYEIIIEPAFVNGKYLSTFADIIYIDGTASSEIIKDLDENSWCEIDFEFNQDDY